MSTHTTTPNDDSTDPRPILQRLFGDGPKVMIVQALHDQPELTSSQLADRTGYDPDILQVVTEQLVEDGVLLGERSNYVQYWRLALDEPVEEALSILTENYGEVDR